MSTIADKLIQLNEIKSETVAATKEKGVTIPAGTTFENIHELWSGISGGGALQEKVAEPMENTVVVLPDSGYDALSKVTVAAALGLQPWNIRKGKTIFGVIGTAEIPVTSDIPEDLPVQKDEADAEFEEIFEEVPPEDLMLLADDQGNITYGYFLDNFEITYYDPATSNFKAIGWRRLSYHTTGEQAGTWIDDDFSEVESGGWNYLKNIISCTREKLYYNGVEIWPNNQYSDGSTAEDLTGIIFPRYMAINVTGKVGSAPAAPVVSAIPDYVSHMSITLSQV